MFGRGTFSDRPLFSTAAVNILQGTWRGGGFLGLGFKRIFAILPMISKTPGPCYSGKDHLTDKVDMT